MKNDSFLKGIKTVGFDFDDTLVDEKYSKNRRWQKTLEKYSFLSQEKISKKYRALKSDKELLLAGAFKILNFLKRKKIIIGIITDGERSYQESRIRTAGIYNLMDFVYYGSGKKERKPNKETLNKIKDFNQFLYVGNDYEKDISGFLFLGAKVCWVTEKGSRTLNNKMIIVKNLVELTNLWKKEF